MKRRVFVSSVQKELQTERKAIRDHVRTDPLLESNFEVVLYEDEPGWHEGGLKGALTCLDTCHVYLLIVGVEYGTEVGNLAMIHHEYRYAKKKLPIFVFVFGERDLERAPGIEELLKEIAGDDIKYKRFHGVRDLIDAVHASLTKLLEARDGAHTDPRPPGCDIVIRLRWLLANGVLVLLILFFLVPGLLHEWRFARLQKVQKDVQSIEERLRARYPEIEPQNHGDRVYVDDSNVILGQDVWRNGRLEQRVLFAEGKLRARDQFQYEGDQIVGKKRIYVDDANRVFLYDTFAADGLLTEKRGCSDGRPQSCVDYFDVMRSPLPAVTQLFFYR